MNIKVMSSVARKGKGGVDNEIFQYGCTHCSSRLDALGGGGESLPTKSNSAHFLCKHFYYITRFNRCDLKKLCFRYFYGKFFPRAYT